MNVLARAIAPPDSPDTAYALFLRTQRALPDSAHMLEPLQAKAQRGVVDIASLGQNGNPPINDAHQK